MTDCYNRMRAMVWAGKFVADHGDDADPTDEAIDAMYQRVGCHPDRRPGPAEIREAIVTNINADASCAISRAVHSLACRDRLPSGACGPRCRLTFRAEGTE